MENYKYLGIQEADTIKERRWRKKKKEKSTSEKPECFSKESSVVEISSKG